MKDCALDYVVDANAPGAVGNAVEKIREIGFVCLRGIAKEDVLASLIQKTNHCLEKPSILGSTGYYMKDCHKKLLEGFLVGPEALQVMLDERLLDIVEGYIGGEALLQEMLVKNDLGANELYFPVHAHTGSYRVEKNPGPFSVGIMLYTHDTNTGAFCFAPGTHLWDVPHGGNLHDYPVEMQKEINQKLCRVVGKRGDIVLFDHRGFHGPEQPVTVPRTVFLGGFHDAKSHGYKMKTCTVVYVHDLATLSEKQKRVIGLHSKGAIIPKEKMHYFSFDRANPGGFKLASCALSGMFRLMRFKFTTKRIIKDIAYGMRGKTPPEKIQLQEAE